MVQRPAVRRALREAIRATFSADTHTGEPSTFLIEVVALAVELMADVSNARQARVADNPAFRKPAKSHLMHACVHLDIAHLAEQTGTHIHLDPESGQLHLGHALMRCAFALGRIRGIGGESE
jgi:hypothetical protein